MKKNKCSLPESPDFKIKHPRESFFEWNDRMNKLYELWCNKQKERNESTNIDFFDYDWMDDEHES